MKTLCLYYSRTDLNFYDRVIIGMPIWAESPLPLQRNYEAAGRCRQHIRYIVCRNIAGYDNRSEKA